MRKENKVAKMVKKIAVASCKKCGKQEVCYHAV